MAEYSIDCKGEACPVPLLNTERKLDELAKGDTLIVTVDHTCAIKNIPEWSRLHGHNVETIEIGTGVWAIVIVK